MYEQLGSGKPLDQIQVLFTAGTAVGLTDRDLLERFLHDGREAGEAAFTALVERHGPMVLRVCNQALRDRHAAEDAFQATFLVLARRARSIRERDSVESWLFGVASRAAARVRMLEARRQRYERRGAISKVHDDNKMTELSEPWPELHAAIARLPEKYRVPIVLCYFEGLTHDQAAARLGWPVGTVKTRLARAREQLRRHLDRLGWNSALILSADHFRPWDVSAVPRLLLDSTTRGAAGFVFDASAGRFISSTVLAITHGVLRGMLINQLRVAAVTLFGMATLGLGAMVLARQAPGAGQVRARTDAVAAAAAAIQTSQPTVLNVFGKTDLAPETVVRIHAPFDCRVDKILVELGSNVKKGDPLLELFSTDLAEAKGNYEAAIGHWERDKKVLDYKTPLAKANNIPRTELIAAENDEAQSRLKMNRAKDKLLMYGLTDTEIENAKTQEGIQKAKMILRSRGDGVVVERSVVAGNYYTRIDALLAIAKIDMLWVSGKVDAQYADSLEIGRRVTVVFPFSDKSASVKVEAISRTVEQGSEKVLFRASIPNTNRRIKAGMFVRLLVELRPKAASPKVTEIPPKRQSNPSLDERLSEVEQKLERLLEEKDARSSNQEILRRLSELEQKLDRALNFGAGK